MAVQAKSCQAAKVPFSMALRRTFCSKEQYLYAFGPCLKTDCMANLIPDRPSLGVHDVCNIPQAAGGCSPFHATRNFDGYEKDVIGCLYRVGISGRYPI